MVENRPGLDYSVGPKEVGVAQVDPHLSICQHFVRCILENLEPEVPAGEGMRDLEVIVAAHRSMEERRAIKLPLG